MNSKNLGLRICNRRFAGRIAAFSTFLLAAINCPANPTRVLVTPPLWPKPSFKAMPEKSACCPLCRPNGRTAPSVACELAADTR